MVDKSPQYYCKLCRMSFDIRKLYYIHIDGLPHRDLRYRLRPLSILASDEEDEELEEGELSDYEQPDWGPSADVDRGRLRGDVDRGMLWEDIDRGALQGVLSQQSRRSDQRIERSVRGVRNGRGRWVEEDKGGGKEDRGEGKEEGECDEEEDGRARMSWEDNNNLYDPLREQTLCSLNEASMVEQEEQPDTISREKRRQKRQRKRYHKQQIVKLKMKKPRLGDLGEKQPLMINQTFEQGPLSGQCEKQLVIGRCEQQPMIGQREDAGQEWWCDERIWVSTDDEYEYNVIVKFKDVSGGTSFGTVESEQSYTDEQVVHMESQIRNCSHAFAELDESLQLADPCPTDSRLTPITIDYQHQSLHRTQADKLQRHLAAEQLTINYIPDPSSADIEQLTADLAVEKLSLDPCPQSQRLPSSLNRHDAVMKELLKHDRGIDSLSSVRLPPDIGPGHMSSSEAATHLLKEDNKIKESLLSLSKFRSFVKSKADRYAELTRQTLQLLTDSDLLEPNGEPIRSQDTTASTNDRTCSVNEGGFSESEYICCRSDEDVPINSPRELDVTVAACYTLTSANHAQDTKGSANHVLDTKASANRVQDTKTSTSDNTSRSSVSTNVIPCSSASTNANPRSSANEKPPSSASANQNTPPSASVYEKPRSSVSENSHSSANELPSSSSSIENPRSSASANKNSRSSANEKHRSSASANGKPHSTSSVNEKHPSSISAREKLRSSASDNEKPRLSASTNDKPRSLVSVNEKPHSAASANDKPRSSASVYDKPPSVDGERVFLVVDSPSKSGEDLRDLINARCHGPIVTTDIAPYCDSITTDITQLVDMIANDIKLRQLITNNITLCESAITHDIVPDNAMPLNGVVTDIIKSHDMPANSEGASHNVPASSEGASHTMPVNSNCASHNGPINSDGASHNVPANSDDPSHNAISHSAIMYNVRQPPEAAGDDLAMYSRLQVGCVPAVLRSSSDSVRSIHPVQCGNSDSTTYSGEVKLCLVSGHRLDSTDTGSTVYGGDMEVDEEVSQNGGSVTCNDDRSSVLFKPDDSVLPGVVSSSTTSRINFRGRSRVELADNEILQTSGRMSFSNMSSSLSDKLQTANVPSINLSSSASLTSDIMVPSILADSEVSKVADGFLQVLRNMSNLVSSLGENENDNVLIDPPNNTIISNIHGDEDFRIGMMNITGNTGQNNSARSRYTGNRDQHPIFVKTGDGNPRDRRPIFVNIDDDIRQVIGSVPQDTFCFVPTESEFRAPARTGHFQSPYEYEAKHSGNSDVKSKRAPSRTGRFQSAFEYEAKRIQRNTRGNTAIISPLQSTEFKNSDSTPHLISPVLRNPDIGAEPSCSAENSKSLLNEPIRLRYLNKPKSVDLVDGVIGDETRKEESRETFSISVVTGLRGRTGPLNGDRGPNGHERNQNGRGVMLNDHHSGTTRGSDGIRPDGATDFDYRSRSRDFKTSDFTDNGSRLDSRKCSEFVSNRNPSDDRRSSESGHSFNDVRTMSDNRHRSKDRNSSELDPHRTRNGSGYRHLSSDRKSSGSDRSSNRDMRTAPDYNRRDHDLIWNSGLERSNSRDLGIGSDYRSRSGERKNLDCERDARNTPDDKKRAGARVVKNSSYSNHGHDWRQVAEKRSSGLVFKKVSDYKICSRDNNLGKQPDYRKLSTLVRNSGDVKDRERCDAHSRSQVCSSDRQFGDERITEKRSSNCDISTESFNKNTHNEQDFDNRDSNSNQKLSSDRDLIKESYRSRYLSDRYCHRLLENRNNSGDLDMTGILNPRPAQRADQRDSVHESGEPRRLGANETRDIQSSSSSISDSRSNKLLMMLSQSAAIIPLDVSRLLNS